MRFELFIALRYLLARRRQAFISVISLISTIGVGVGVIALIVALAMMTGIQGELRDRILGSTAHVYVWKTGGITDYRAEVARLQAIDGVVGAGPAVMGKALISTDRADAFISLKGVDPTLEGNVTDVRRSMQSGSISARTPAAEDDPPGILIGRNLAEQLGLSVGETATLLTPQGTLSPMGMIPRTRRVRVLPRRSMSPVCRTRSNLPWAVRLSIAISSRNSVPLCAASKRPPRDSTAPE